MFALWVISRGWTLPSLGTAVNIWLLTAGIGSFAICITHIILGGKFAARPLLSSSDLGPTAKYTNYYCWHMVSIVIAGMGLMFILAAALEDALILSWPATIFASLFSLWNIALYVWTRRHFRHWYQLPQWLLFAPVAVLGWIGLTGG